MSADMTNPKDLLGTKKVPNLSVIPAASIIYEGLAMRYGAFEAPLQGGGNGYGPFNWREKQVRASIYVDACLRHLMSWVDGEANASDSGVPHLGHAKACLGILADAIESGNLVDDRPKAGPAPALLESLKRGPGPDGASRETDRVGPVAVRRCTACGVPLVPGLTHYSPGPGAACILKLLGGAGDPL